MKLNNFNFYLFVKQNPCLAVIVCGFSGDWLCLHVYMLCLEDDEDVISLLFQPEERAPISCSSNNEHPQSKLCNFPCNCRQAE